MVEEALLHMNALPAWSEPRAQCQMKNWKTVKHPDKSIHTIHIHKKNVCAMLKAERGTASKVNKQETGGKQFTRIYLMVLISFQAAKALDDWNKSTPAKT